MKIKKLSRKNLRTVSNSRTFSYTPAVIDPEAAVAAKVKALKGNFFGKPILNFDVISERKVYVPYCYIVYEYSVNGGRNIFKRASKSGEIGIVYDMNEQHPFQYDIYDKGHLPLERGAESCEAYSVMKVDVSDLNIRKSVEEFIRYNVMLKAFGTKGEIKLVSFKKFYRPAVELEVLYRGKNTNMRYAYLDEYGVNSEHVSGMKVRLNHRG